MEHRNIPFSPPDVGELEIAGVADTLRSGWITTGPKTKLLEKKIADWIGVGRTEGDTPRCVCLNSQTACAEMALRLMGIGRDSGGSEDDEVIVPAYTYTASASVVCHVGAKLVLVDIQPDSLELNYEQVERAITSKTKAIIPVDIAGIPCDYERLFAIVESKKAMYQPANELQNALGRVAIMADTAHAFGSTYHGKMVGNVADFSSFSFHAVKNLTTAEGGALTWRSITGIKDEDLYKKFQLLSLHGQSKDALAKSKIGAWEYDIVGTYYKCNMTDIAAAMGLAQFERYPDMLVRRREIIERYNAAFEPLGVEVLPHYTEEYQSSGHLYITRLPGVTDEQRREAIVRMAERGVNCNVHYKPLPMHTAYMRRGFDINGYPNAYAAYVNEITLPLHTRLTEEDVEYIIENYCEVVKDYLNK